MRSAPAPDLPRTTARPLPHHILCLPTALALLVSCAIACSESPVAPSKHPLPVPDTGQASVTADNALPGTTSWVVEDRAPAGNLGIWVGPYAAERDDTLQLHIRSLRDSLRVTIYRIGWYGGMGARLVYTSPVLGRQLQPDCTPAFPGPVVCPWSSSLTVPVDPRWAGGIYIAKVVDRIGQGTAYPFVIKSRRPHDFLAVVPQFTWQAYNAYGGSGFYVVDPATHRTTPQVSFQRPYHLETTSGFVLGGSHDLLAAQWLESQGYDVGYASDADLADPRLTPPTPIHGVIFLGHDEYWTWSEYDRVEAMRDRGIHLAFLAANNAYWNARLSDDSVTGRPDQILTCAKGLPDPGARSTPETGVRFREAPLHRPENALYGIMTDLLLPAGEVGGEFGVQSPEAADIEARQFIDGRRVVPGDSLGFPIGREGDRVVDNGAGPANIQILAEAVYVDRTTSARIANNATFFRAPSGAGVFATGSNLWTQALAQLGPKAPVSELTNAVLDWILRH